MNPTSNVDAVLEAIGKAGELFVAGRSYPSGAALVRPLLDGVDPDTADADHLLANTGLLFAHTAAAPAINRIRAK